MTQEIRSTKKSPTQNWITRELEITDSDRQILEKAKQQVDGQDNDHCPELAASGYQWKEIAQGAMPIPDGVHLVARPNDDLVVSEVDVDSGANDSVPSARPPAELYEGYETFGAPPVSVASSADDASEDQSSPTNLKRSSDRQLRIDPGPEFNAPHSSLLEGLDLLAQSQTSASSKSCELPEIVIVDAVDEEKEDETAGLASESPASQSGDWMQDLIATQVSEATAEVTADSANELEVVPEDRGVDSKVVVPGVVTETVRAAWEVEAFQWPEVTTELLERQPEVFSQLHAALGEVGPIANSLALTSGQPGDGRSTLSICFARWAAAQGHRTLLIDADFSRGNLVNLAGLDFEFGWQQLVNEGMPVEEFLVACDSVPLTLMCLQSFRIPAGGEPVAAAKLSEVVFGLRSQFDVLVLDCGTAADLQQLFSEISLPVDLAVYVRSMDFGEEVELSDVQTQLQSIGLSHMAIADNFGHRKAA